MKIYKNVFEKIISSENLFAAWDKFRSDKQKKRDVCEFEWELEKNIFELHRDLVNKRYKHGAHTSFFIHDPKRRHIHKAIVRDRVLHHAIFNILNPIFEPTFIANSYSCRIGYGTHTGVDALDSFIRKTSQNYTKPCYVLKCDIKKFFDSVNHEILFSILKRRIKDKDALCLLQESIESYVSAERGRKGIPIGNLTSQLFANIYMNEFDQFVKHEWKVKYYARYTDDFIIVGPNREGLDGYLPRIIEFLDKKLALALHPNKVSIRKFHQGVDFLGYVTLPHHKLLRSKTKGRIFRKLRMRVREYKSGVITKQTLEQSLQSYLGVLSHANAYELSQELLSQYWFWIGD